MALTVGMVGGRSKRRPYECDGYISVNPIAFAKTVGMFRGVWEAAPYNKSIYNYLNIFINLNAQISTLYTLHSTLTLCTLHSTLI